MYHPVFQLEFDEPVFVMTVNIYETYHAGGLKSIKGMTKEGIWQSLWKTNKVTCITQPRIFSPELSVSCLCNKALYNCSNPTQNPTLQF